MALSPSALQTQWDHILSIAINANANLHSVGSPAGVGVGGPVSGGWPIPFPFFRRREWHWRGGVAPWLARRLVFCALNFGSVGAQLMCENMIGCLGQLELPPAPGRLARGGRDQTANVRGVCPAILGVFPLPLSGGLRVRPEWRGALRTTHPASGSSPPGPLDERSSCCGNCIAEASSSKGWSLFLLGGAFGKFGKKP